MASEAVLLTERAGAITILTLNRPARHNAMDPELAARLTDAFDDFVADSEARVLVLTGAGERAFCSGGDLELTLPLLSGARRPENAWDRRLLSDPSLLTRGALRDVAIDKPIVAAVNGFCLAGGAEMLLGTDVRIAAEHATFGLPEVRHALIPFAGSLVRLQRQIPYCSAMELLLTGEPIDAHEALRLGLVNAVVPAAEVMPRALAIARRIAANGPLAVREIKRTVLATSGVPLREAFAAEDAARARVMATADAREGPAAFREKRAPFYRGA